MSRLEDDLRTTLRQHAPSPDAVRAPRWPDAAHRRPAWVRWGAPLAAAAVAVTVLVGGKVVVDRAVDQAPTPKPVTSTPAPPTPRVVPSGFRTVSYRGVEVLVPSDLTADDLACGSPVRRHGKWVSTVAVGPEDSDSSAGSCVGYFEEPSDVRIVRLLPTESDQATGSELARTATTPVTVDGKQAFTNCSTCAADRFSDGAVLYFPDNRVVVTATDYGKGELASPVLGSAQVRDVDSLGCPTTRSGPPPAATTPLSPLADVAFAYTSAVVCTYADGVSEGSAALDQEAARDLAGELMDGPKFVDRRGPGCGVSGAADAFDLAVVRVASPKRDHEYVVVDEPCAAYALIDGVLVGGRSTIGINGKDIDLITRLRGS